MKVKLVDLPPPLRERVEAAMAKEDARRTPPHPTPATTPLPLPPRARRAPSKTELRYRREVLDYNASVSGVAWEGVTFRMANGHRYTPDWTYWQGGRLHAVEVKGSYRLGSYQRARLAFDQARVEWPAIVWIWAELENGTWRTIAAS